MEEGRKNLRSKAEKLEENTLVGDCSHFKSLTECALQCKKSFSFPAFQTCIVIFLSLNIDKISHLVIKILYIDNLSR